MRQEKYLWRFKAAFDLLVTTVRHLNKNQLVTVRSITLKQDIVNPMAFSFIDDLCTINDGGEL